MSQIKIDRSAAISYDKKDPRYNLTIEDSNEYIKNIYPLHFKKKCIKDHDIKYDFPLLYRCWGERYENCSIMQRHIETGYCNCAECSKCMMTLYETIPDTIDFDGINLSSQESKLNTLNLRDLKPQNQSTIYDRTRVSIHDNVDIDKSPAIIENFVGAVVADGLINANVLPGGVGEVGKTIINPVNILKDPIGTLTNPLSKITNPIESLGLEKYKDYISYGSIASLLIVAFMGFMYFVMVFMR